MRATPRTDALALEMQHAFDKAKGGFGEIARKLVHQCEEFEREIALPSELFDGVAVYVALGTESDIRPHQVAAVLDAVVKLIRKNRRDAQSQPQSGESK